MSDDYLVDKEGRAPADVQRLEGLLADARYKPKRLRLPAAPRRWVPLALAASLALAAAGALLWRLSTPSFEVRETSASGEVRGGRLAVGSFWETGEGARAEVKVADIGQIQLEPLSRLK